MGLAFFPASNANANAKAKVKPTIVTTPTTTTTATSITTGAGTKYAGAGVLIIPGGGYSFVSLDYEGADAVRWLNARGLDAWVLDYTTTCAAPAPLYPTPLGEAADAVRCIRGCLEGQLQSRDLQGGGSSSSSSSSKATVSVADEGGKGGEGDGEGDGDGNKVGRYRLGIWGFSAGAHLAALTLTSPDVEPLLDFAVLAYPVVSMTPDDNDGDIVVAHLGSRRNLLGDGSTGPRGSGDVGGVGGDADASTARSRSASASAAARAAAAMAVVPKTIQEKKEGGEDGGSKEDLFDDIPQLQRQMSPHRAVGPGTPPVFIFHTANDPAVPVQNALLFAGAMARQARPFQLLVLPDGRHGISLALDDPKLSWTGELERWLRWSVGVLG